MERSRERAGKNRGQEKAVQLVEDVAVVRNVEKGTDPHPQRLREGTQAAIKGNAPC